MEVLEIQSYEGSALVVCLPDVTVEAPLLIAIKAAFVKGTRHCLNKYCGRETKYENYMLNFIQRNEAI